MDSGEVARRIAAWRGSKGIGPVRRGRRSVEIQTDIPYEQAAKLSAAFEHAARELGIKCRLSARHGFITLYREPEDLPEHEYLDLFRVVVRVEEAAATDVAAPSQDPS